MSDLKKLLDIIDENSSSEKIEIHDSFDIELTNGFVIETGVVGFREDGIIIEADDIACKLLGINGILLENEEYDDEAGMADNNLETLERAVEGIDELISAGDNLPEWCQEKIAVSKSMLVAVWDYMKSEEQSDEVAEGKPGLWANIHAKRERIKSGSGERMRKPGSKGAPSAQDFKDAAKEGYEGVAEGEYKSRHIHRQEQNKKYDEYRRSQEAAGKKPMSRGDWAATQRKGQQGVAEGSDGAVSFREMIDVVDQHYPKYYAELSSSDISEKQFERAIVNAYKAIIKKQGVAEAEYQGRKVPLGKPMQGDVKKSKVYVRKPNGKVVKVNFGDKNMKIKKSNPDRRKSFRARHNCDNPGPRWKARYWSCRAW